MIKFKVGDKVKCVRGQFGFLEAGQVYHVRDIFEEYVYIGTGLGDGWFSSRFELLGKELPSKVATTVDNSVEPPKMPDAEFPVGSFVRCVNDSPHSGDGCCHIKRLVLNRIYHVSESNVSTIRVYGSERAWRKPRFTQATLSDYHSQCIADTGFKIGDKVRPKVKSPTFSESMLAALGFLDSHTVDGFRFSGAKMDGMTLREIIGVYNPSQFELVPAAPGPKFRKGDIVTCIDDGGTYNIAKGRTYIVDEWYDSPAIGETVCGSMSIRGAANGDKSHYAARLFEMASASVDVFENPKRPFNPGDRVTCFDDSGVTNITKGHEYIISEVIPRDVDGNGPSVRLKNAANKDSSRYDSRLFEISPPLKTGDRVTCIEAGNGVRYGAEYTTMSDERIAMYMGYVDVGSVCGDCFANRFVRLPKKPSPIFAAGDLIVCVDASPREDGPAHNLVQGGIYRVDSIATAMEGHQLVRAESHGSTYPRQKGDWLASWRFDKYKGSVAKPVYGVSPVADWLGIGHHWTSKQLLHDALRNAYEGTPIRWTL